MLIGIILLIFKNKYGKPLFYIGLIFYSFLLISFSVNQIKDNQLFLFCISTFSSSFIMSLITGTLITVVLQSSSVFVAILQILAISGLLTIEQAIPFIFGANIGTTLDSFYGVFGDKKDAKKLASFNLMFNVLSVIIFSILINPFKYIIRLIINALNQNISINIAIINIVFNTLSVLIVLPFVNKIKKIYDKW
jgi:phosphate:Na+ symporter